MNIIAKRLMTVPCQPTQRPRGQAPLDRGEGLKSVRGALRPGPAPSSQVTALEVPVLTSAGHYPHLHRTQATSTAHTATSCRAQTGHCQDRTCSSTYNIASQQHALTQTACTHRHGPFFARRHPSPPCTLHDWPSLPAVCCVPLASLPVCCVPPTHVTPPRRAAFDSVACSAGGLRKERGQAWGVSGRDV